MKTLKTLSRHHIDRVLQIKAGLDALEEELCKVLHLPASFTAFRKRARLKLIPPALQRQIDAAEKDRLARRAAAGAPEPLWKAHFERKAAVRGRIKKAATAGWNKLRRSPKNK